MTGIELNYDDDDFDEIDPRDLPNTHVVSLNSFSDVFFFEKTPASNGICIKGVREKVLYAGSKDYPSTINLKKLVVPSHVDFGYIDDEGERCFDDSKPHEFYQVWLPGDCSKLFGVYIKETFTGTVHENERMGLEEIDLSHIIDTSNVTNTSKMFRGNYNLDEIKFPEVKPFPNVTKAIEMFRRSGVRKINMGTFGKEDIEVTGMFKDTPNFESTESTNENIIKIFKTEHPNSLNI